MAHKPNKKRRPHKLPSAGQRLKAQVKRTGGLGRGTSQPAVGHRPDVRIDKAQIAWDQRRFDEAIWYYERALARDPQNPILLVDVARAYALRYRFADAERLVNLAQSLYPDDARLQSMLGRSFVQLQQFDRAIACYRRALELAPTSPERPSTLLELAKMHERLHDLDAAQVCAEEALSLAPHFGPAQYTLGTILRRAGNIEQATALWRQLIDTKQAAHGRDCRFTLPAGDHARCRRAI